MTEDFVVLLKALMIEENGYTAEDADRLIKKYPSIIVRGIISGNIALRGTIMTIERKEVEGK